MNKIIYTSILQLLLVPSILLAQTPDNIANNFTSSERNNYSKIISLFPYSSLVNSINNGNKLTILLQDDQFMDQLPAISKELLFNQHDPKAIDDFFSGYSIDGLWDYTRISTGITSGVKELQLVNRKGETLKLSKHMNSFLVANLPYFEANILGSQPVNQSLFYFL